MFFFHSRLCTGVSEYSRSLCVQDKSRKTIVTTTKTTTVTSDTVYDEDEFDGSGIIGTDIFAPTTTETEETTIIKNYYITNYSGGYYYNYPYRYYYEYYDPWYWGRGPYISVGLSWYWNWHTPWYYPIYTCYAPYYSYGSYYMSHYYGWPYYYNSYYHNNRYYQNLNYRDYLASPRSTYNPSRRDAYNSSSGSGRYGASQRGTGVGTRQQTTNVRGYESAPRQAGSDSRSVGDRRSSGARSIEVDNNNKAVERNTSPRQVEQKPTLSPSVRAVDRGSTTNTNNNTDNNSRNRGGSYSAPAPSQRSVGGSTSGGGSRSTGGASSGGERRSSGTGRR